MNDINFIITRTGNKFDEESTYQLLCDIMEDIDKRERGQYKNEEKCDVA